jgi:hypothetical protein
MTASGKGPSVLACSAFPIRLYPAARSERVNLHQIELVREGGTGACVRCEEAGTRPSARVGLAMSVFTHGVNSKGKPEVINRNKVFPVVRRTKYPEGGGTSRPGRDAGKCSAVGVSLTNTATYELP